MDDLRIPPGPGCPRGLVVPTGELIERFSHASGPGGQGVNTADSRVQLSLDLATTTALNDKQRERALSVLGDRLTGTILTITAAEHRSRAATGVRRASGSGRSCVRPLPRPSPGAPRSRREGRSCAASRRRGDVRRSRRAGAAPTRTKKNEAGVGYVHALPSVRQPMNVQVTGSR